MGGDRRSESGAVVRVQTEYILFDMMLENFGFVSPFQVSICDLVGHCTPLTRRNVVVVVHEM